MFGASIVQLLVYVYATADGDVLGSRPPHIVTASCKGGDHVCPGMSGTGGYP